LIPGHPRRILRRHRARPGPFGPGACRSGCIGIRRSCALCSA